jgi:hypothetical protein
MSIKMGWNHNRCGHSEENENVFSVVIIELWFFGGAEVSVSKFHRCCMGRSCAYMRSRVVPARDMCTWLQADVWTQYRLSTNLLQATSRVTKKEKVLLLLSPATPRLAFLWPRHKAYRPTTSNEKRHKYNPEHKSVYIYGLSNGCQHRMISARVSRDPPPPQKKN